MGTISKTGITCYPFGDGYLRYSSGGHWVVIDKELLFKELVKEFSARLYLDDDLEKKYESNKRNYAEDN